MNLNSRSLLSTKDGCANQKKILGLIPRNSQGLILMDKPNNFKEICCHHITSTIKKVMCVGLILGFHAVASAQQKVKDGSVVGSNLPNKDAILELESSNKGFLHVRVSLTRTTDSAPLTSHVAGMMVYNTATVNDVLPGIYYNDGTKWVFVRSSNNIIVENQPGKTGSPGIPGTTGGPGVGVTIVNNDSGTWVFNPTTNSWTNIKGGNGINGTNGTSLTSGATAPTGTGAIGDTYINTATGDTYVYNGTSWVSSGNIKGAKGDPGTNGTNGINGTNGTSLTSGATAPTGTGATGDTYINTTTGDTYVYNGTSWVSNGNIKGAKGDTGAAGTNGTNGTSLTSGTTAPTGTGATGDTYINTTTGDTYVYNGTSWVSNGNIKGAKGDPGAAGTNGTNGTSLTSGATAPTGTGATGDTYINTTTGDTYVYNGTSWVSNGNIKGAKGDPGAAGTNGINGTSLTSGATAPTGTGATGDTYINTATGDTYVYNGTSWVSNGNIKGAKGDPGAAGTNGTNGTSLTSGTTAPTGTGATGDTYINTTTGDTYVYNGTSWVSNGNIKGAKGDTGAQGAQGPIGATGTTGAAGQGGVTTAGTDISVTGAGTATDSYVINSKITASNGLTKSSSDIQLGGALTKPTTITTTVVNTLAVAGLQTGVSTDKIVVADPNGVLKTVNASSLAANNIYNANGSLTADRELDFNGRSLTFKGTTGSFDLETGGGYATLHGSNPDRARFRLSTDDINANGTSSVFDMSLFSDNYLQMFAMGEMNGISFGTHVTLNPSPIEFVTSPGANALGETRMKIEGNGNIGINESNPTEKLDVGNGNVRIRDINTITGSITTDKMIVADVDGVLKTISTSNLIVEPWQVQGTTTQATTNAQNIYQTGAVAIGANTIPSFTVGSATINPMLHVAGDVSTTGKIYTTNSVYADYVFEDYFDGFSKIYKDYKFKSLKEVAGYIKANKHLPGVTPIDDLAKSKSGYTIDLTQLSVQQLEKLEELYLHVIEMNDALSLKDKEIKALQNKTNDLEERLKKLEYLLIKK